MRFSLITALALSLAYSVLFPALAHAQQTAQVRIQEGTRDAQQIAPNAPRSAIILDYREEMRKFIQSISIFARKYRPDFAIIAENGLDLVVKREEDDETRTFPARTYVRSIDGVLQEAMFFGKQKFGKPNANKESQEQTLKLAEQAQKSGLKVFTMDYARTPAVIDKAIRMNAAKKFIPFVAPAKGRDLNSLPRYPKRPVNENPNSIVSLSTVRNFLRIGDSAAFGRQDEFTLKIHETNYDLVIVDVFHGRSPLSKQAVETLKYKKIGGRRKVLAYMDIGSASSYLYYWKPYWREGSPLWLSAPVRGDPDRFYVEYWNPEWQKIITGDTKSYVYGAIDLGFDGVVLGGIDAYRYFETGGEILDEEQ